jgi:hypothetical protein
MGEIMIHLAKLARQHEQAFRSSYQHKMTNDHYHALRALIDCRTPVYGQMQYRCDPCEQQQTFCHSCGHRSCPKCQHLTNCQWLARQQQKLLPVDYFMVTFTLPYELRNFVWQHQEDAYNSLFSAAIDTLNAFAKNDKDLRGKLGMTAVLHTHSRRLAFHPHVHVLIPAGAFNGARTGWRQKSSGYLFNGLALAKVFRAKFLAQMAYLELEPPKALPKKWIAQCQSMGRGEPALKYLARYLYRGVIDERNILSERDGLISFRFKDSKTNAWKTRTETAVKFLWLVLQHVLPKGFRRARDYGFLHGNAKRILQKIQLTLKVVLDKFELPKRKERLCSCCKKVMDFIRFSKAPMPRYYKTG